MRLAFLIEVCRSWRRTRSKERHHGDHHHPPQVHIHLEAEADPAPWRRQAPARRRRKQATAKEATAKKRTTAKPAAKRNGHSPNTPAILAAVRAGEKLAGKSKSGTPRATCGPAQVKRIRAYFTRIIDGPVTPEKIVAASGVESAKAPRDLATYRDGVSAMKPLRVHNEHLTWPKSGKVDS
jgi:hypothetical protein